jgi:hypothetical protein
MTDKIKLRNPVPGIQHIYVDNVLDIPPRILEALLDASYVLDNGELRLAPGSEIGVYGRSIRAAVLGLEFKNCRRLAGRTNVYTRNAFSTSRIDSLGLRPRPPALSTTVPNSPSTKASRSKKMIKVKK